METGIALTVGVKHDHSESQFGQNSSQQDSQGRLAGASLERKRGNQQWGYCTDSSSCVGKKICSSIQIQYTQ